MSLQTPTTIRSRPNKLYGKAKATPIGRRRGPAVKSVGKPDALIGHVRFDERGRETERLAKPQAAAPFLDSTVRLRRLYKLIQQLQRLRKPALAHEQKRGVVERVCIGRLNGEGSLVARERFIPPTDLLLKNAEVEPSVRKIRVARHRLPIGDFRVALAPQVVQNIAEIERNDRIVPVEPGGEIVKPLRRFKIPLLLVFLCSREHLVGVNV